MPSVDFYDIKNAASGIIDNAKDRVIEFAERINNSYDEYNVNINAEHHENENDEPTFKKSYSGKFKIRLSDLILVTLFFSSFISIMRSIKRFFK